MIVETREPSIFTSIYLFGNSFYWSGLNLISMIHPSVVMELNNYFWFLVLTMTIVVALLERCIRTKWQRIEWVLRSLWKESDSDKRKTHFLRYFILSHKRKSIRRAIFDGRKALQQCSTLRYIFRKARSRNYFKKILKHVLHLLKLLSARKCGRKKEYIFKSVECINAERVNVKNVEKWRNTTHKLSHKILMRICEKRGKWSAIDKTIQTLSFQSA